MYSSDAPCGRHGEAAHRKKVTLTQRLNLFPEQMKTRRASLLNTTSPLLSFIAKFPSFCIGLLGFLPSSEFFKDLPLTLMSKR